MCIDKLNAELTSTQEEVVKVAFAQDEGGAVAQRFSKCWQVIPCSVLFNDVFRNAVMDAGSGHIIERTNTQKRVIYRVNSARCRFQHR